MIGAPAVAAAALLDVRFPKLFLMLLLNVNGRLRHRIVLRGIVHHVLANRFQDQISRNPSVGVWIAVLCSV